MKFECYLIDDATLDIQPGHRRREWMSATHEAFAYRCLPLSMANEHGWEIRCPASFEAQWNGGDNSDDVQITSDCNMSSLLEAHFGYGILTFRINGVFRTPPGYNLWVMGPPNSFKDGIQALSAMIETDWMPYTFTMNWKFTRPQVPVRFEQGEPFCFLFPVKRGALETFRPEIKSIDRDPVLKKRHRVALLKRNMVRGVQEFKGYLDRSLLFQQWYMNGQMPDGTGKFDDHQKKLSLRPFTRNK